VRIGGSTSPVLAGGLQVAWARFGGYHLELIEAVADTPWTPRPEPYLHHVGWWVDEPADASAALTKAGLPRLATFWTDDGSARHFAYHRLGEVQIEVSATSRGAEIRRTLDAAAGPPVAGADFLPAEVLPTFVGVRVLDPDGFAIQAARVTGVRLEGFAAGAGGAGYDHLAYRLADPASAARRLAELGLAASEREPGIFAAAGLRLSLLPSGRGPGLSSTSP
jgi:hypothetical protein